MASEETSSISKGCFLFNPNANKNSSGNKTKTRRKRQRKATKRLFQGDRFPILKGETDKQTDLRYSNYQECWGNMLQQIESIQIETNRKVFSNMLEFIKKSHRNDGLRLPRREIPTAALLTGMNMPDHEVIFQQITSDLSQDITPYVALLHSKDCSNLKFLLREVLTQLMTSNDETEETEDDLDKSCIEDMGKLKQFTLAVLKSWYAEKVKISDERPPVVMIFEDFEGFHQPVLQDFIQICGEYTDSIPIVFVFSLATTIAAVHRSLPHSVSTRLSIEKFQAEPSLECLHGILNKVFLTAEHPLKLGPRMSHLLFDKFLCQDFSIQNFASAVQLFLMEHFYNNPLSILCTNDKDTLDSSIDELSESHLNYVRQSRSFQRYSDRKSLADQNKLQNDNLYLKRTVKEMIEDIEQLKSHLFPILKCLHVLTSRLPGCPFGKRLKDVYELCLEQELFKSDLYKNSMILMKQTARDDLLHSLNNCCSILKDSSEEASLDGSIDEILKELEVLVARFGEIDEMQRKNCELEVQQNPSKTPAKMPKYKNRFELQERMRREMKEKKATPYDNLRSDVVDFWDKIFRKFLRCPMKLPLHEVMFFDDVDSVSPHINATPRLAVQNALRNPCHYLKCKCCKIDSGENQETLPDISIVYKIHLECGRMINLYDWLQAFATVADPCPATKKNSKKRQAEDEKLQARFIQSVSELQLLGFIKPTKRKTDHVQRLTWGF